MSSLAFKGRPSARSWCALASAALLASCGAATGGGHRRPEGELDQFFIGTQAIPLEEGAAPSNVLVRRHVDRDHRLVQDSVDIVRAGQVIEHHELTILLTEEGDYESATFDGEPVREGRLNGPAWNWTHFSGEIELGDGTRMQLVEDTFGDASRTEADLDSNRGSPAGPSVIRLSLQRVTPARYQLSREELRR